MNIVIVGGGTAGWISAFFIAKAQPNKHKITVIESSKIGIIGAGEGSTGSMIDLLNGSFFDFKVDLKDFIDKTDATFKMGIRHENWSPHMDSYFAPLDASPTGYTLDDYIFKHVLCNQDRKNIHLASEIGIKYENKNYSTPYALHFDGHKVGKYFKSLCLADNIEFIDSVVEDVNLDTTGNIQSLTLEDRVLDGDFFIDCTGFSRILMKKLGVGWKSYDDILSLNTAMPFLINYKEGEKIIPETKATALSSGWMWNIPLSTRRGCGYVFDSRYISKEDAKKEVETYLGRSVEPIKWIEFTSGHSETFWKNNALCLGLASSFVEPLEATSIHNTIIQTAIFVKEFLELDKEKTISNINQTVYNERITFLNKLTIDFISLHYQGGRDDTPFWKNIKDNEKFTVTAKKIFKLAKHRIPGYVDIEGMYGSYSMPLVNWIYAGMGIYNLEQAERDLNRFDNILGAKIQYEKFYNQISHTKPYISYV